MRAQTRFEGFDPAHGGYESYYLRAVDPDRPRGVWLRHTVHQSPGHGPIGSIWLTVFDAEADGPVAIKQSIPGPTVPDGAYLAVGESVFGPDSVRGSATADGRSASYDLRYEGEEPDLEHLPKPWMYTAKLPRTKLHSPHPAVRYSGSVTIDGRTVELAGWPGMVGHNWGAQHAERWIWLHGTCFDDVEDAWVDIALGRIKIGPATTPWIANGVVSVGGVRTRLGGPGRIRKTKVHEDPLRLDFDLAGDGIRLEGTVHSPRAQTVVWRYADPDGSEHNTANCSIAALDLVLHRDGQVPLRLHTAHGGTYELGMRETDHGLPVQPFTDP